MSYTIAVPSSSIQKVLNYGIPSITLVSGGVSVANGTSTVTSLYPDLPPVTDPAYEQANIATGIATSGYNQANTATNLAQTVYDFANTISGGAAIDNVARQIAISAQANTILIQGVNLTQNTWISTNNAIQTGINATQNTRINSIETINTNQNTTISIIQGVDVTQNTRLNSIETVNVDQNTTIAIIQGVDNTQNSWITSNVTQFQSINNTQNTRIQSIETINTNQNTTISIIQGVDATQNARLGSIETINTNQNTTISIIQGVDIWQNNQIIAVNQYAASAYALANSISGGGVSAIDSFARQTANSAAATATNAALVNNTQNTTITQVNQFAQAAFNSANSKVASVTGTTNQITVTGTTNPTLSLSQNIITSSNATFTQLTVGGLPSTANTGELVANNYGTKVNSLGLISGSVTISVDLGNYVVANCSPASTITWTFQNAMASSNACGFILELTNGGSATQIWPNTVNWPRGIPPTLIESGTDVLVFVTADGGTNWRGTLSIPDNKIPV